MKVLTRPERVLAESRLLAEGGFNLPGNIFGKRGVTRMFDEACALYAYATEELNTNPDRENWRGGMPPRKLLSVGAGPVQDQLYGAPALQDLLTELVGVPLVASAQRGSYSFYCRAGDHLGLHRDVDECDVSVITCLSDNIGVDDVGGQLVVYPSRLDEPLGAIRADPERGAHAIRLRAGETIIIAGGALPHFVRPVAENQYRISAPLCFTVRE